MLTISVLTLSLAKMIGLYMIAAGISGLIARERWQAIFDDLQASPALVYIAGFGVFAVGAAINIAHHFWTDPLAIAVTLIGWVALIEGVMLIACPGPLLRFGGSLLKPSRTVPFAIVSIVIGAIFLIAGFTFRVGIV